MKPLLICLMVFKDLNIITYTESNFITDSVVNDIKDKAHLENIKTILSAISVRIKDRASKVMTKEDTNHIKQVWKHIEQFENEIKELSL